MLLMEEKEIKPTKISYERYLNRMYEMMPLDVVLHDLGHLIQNKKATKPIIVNHWANDTLGRFVRHIDPEKFNQGFEKYKQNLKNPNF